MSRSGELSHIGGAVEVEWKITDFLSLSEIDKYLVSPTFNFSGASWYLRCYPNGQSSTNSSGWIALYLTREDSGPPVSLIYTFFLKTAEGEKKRLRESISYDFEKAHYGWGFPTAILRSDLLKIEPQPVPFYVPTITCNLEHPLSSNIASSMKKLSQDMKELFLDGKDSDVIVRVQDKQFPVHRIVLGARTPVFYAMFQHDMQEKNTGIVSINDCDADVFRTFLDYVYTGRAEDLSPDNMLPLYQVADKYQVSELKIHCLECMKSKLSVEVFCDVITLGLKYDEKELVERAMTFFTENATEITATEEWVEFMEKNAKQANELVVTLVKPK